MPSTMHIIGLLDLRAYLTFLRKPKPLIEIGAFSFYFPFLHLKNKQTNVKMQKEGNWQTHSLKRNQIVCELYSYCLILCLMIIIGLSNNIYKLIDISIWHSSKM